MDLVGRGLCHHCHLHCHHHLLNLLTLCPAPHARFLLPGNTAVQDFGTIERGAVLKLAEEKVIVGGVSAARWSVGKVGKAGRTNPTCESGHISPTTPQHHMPPLSSNPPQECRTVCTCFKKAFFPVQIGRQQTNSIFNINFFAA